MVFEVKFQVEVSANIAGLPREDAVDYVRTAAENQLRGGQVATGVVDWHGVEAAPVDEAARKRRVGAAIMNELNGRRMLDDVGADLHDEVGDALAAAALKGGA